MSRLILRVTLGMFAVLIASWLIVAWGFSLERHKHIHRDMALILDDLVELRLHLGATPLAELPRHFEAVRRRIHHPLALIDTSAVPKKLRHTVDTGGLALQMAARHKGPVIYLPLTTSGKVVRLGPLGRLFHPNLTSIVLVLAGIALSLVVVGFVVAFPLVRRLRRLEGAAERIAAGDLSARAGITTKDAIGSLARRFDAMATRIEALLSDQRELLQAVSHELRTPAARLRFGLEMLATDDDADQPQRLAALEADLDDLDALVSELLLYVRLGERPDEPPSAVDLEATIRGLSERLGDLYPDIDLDLDIGHGIASSSPADAMTSPRAWVVTALPRHVDRALKNLLSNALAHAEARVRVAFHASQNGEAIVIHVDDDGPGIPVNAREKIFEPFARTDESRSRDSGGVGLGLAIVQRIVRAYDATVAAEESPLGGARLTIAWPKRDTIQSGTA
ncbi:MAG: HAMP domain-containing protein [Deltaproteobacteria bacterium]|nr:HAMP domain-containing protein [Deltaproteobacteria bacterium]